MRRPRLLRWAMLPLAVLAADGCFATRQDVQILQTDLTAMRAQNQKADSARRDQLDRVISQLGMANDSLHVLSLRTTKGLGDVRGDLYAMGQQLIQIQELTGQSQARLQELRARLEQRGAALTAPPPVIASGAGAAPPSDTSHAAATSPGPNQLYELALDQLRRGSTGTARSGFQDLLQKYPNADIAPDAQFYLAAAYEQEGNKAAADSGYQLVAARYPASPRAATALYKHGIMLQASDKTTAARGAFGDVIRLYPQSDEAVLAKDRLRELK
jgi:tol-pal system protein YbgF